MGSWHCLNQGQRSLQHTAPAHSRHSCLVCEGRAHCTHHHSCHTQHQTCSSPLGRCMSSQDYRNLPSILSSQSFHSILSYPDSLRNSQYSLANHTRGHQDIRRMGQSLEPTGLGTADWMSPHSAHIRRGTSLPRGHTPKIDCSLLSECDKRAA